MLRNSASDTKTTSDGKNCTPVCFLSHHLSSCAFKMAVILGCIDLLLLKLKIHINVVKQSIRLFCGVGGGKVILRIENTTEDP